MRDLLGSPGIPHNHSSIPGHRQQAIPMLVLASPSLAHAIFPRKPPAPPPPAELPQSFSMAEAALAVDTRVRPSLCLWEEEWEGNTFVACNPHNMGLAYRPHKGMTVTSKSLPGGTALSQSPGTERGLSIPTPVVSVHQYLSHNSRHRWLACPSDFFFFLSSHIPGNRLSLGAPCLGLTLTSDLSALTFYPRLCRLQPPTQALN